MATQGLFQLLGESPQEVRRKYEAGLMLSPQEMGQQGLLQQVISTIAQGGTGFGYGLSRALGGKAPGEAEAEATQQALEEAQASGATQSGLLSTMADRFASVGDSRRSILARQMATQAKAQEDAEAAQAETRRLQQEKLGIELDILKGKPAREAKEKQFLSRFIAQNSPTMQDATQVEQFLEGASIDFARKVATEAMKPGQQIKFEAGGEVKLYNTKTGESTVLGKVEQKPMDYGDEAERIAFSKFGKKASELLPTEMSEVDATIQARALKNAQATVADRTLDRATKLSGLTNSYLKIAKPDQDVISNANIALEQLELARKGNSQAYQSVIRQLAKLSGEKQISQRDVDAFGFDKSFVGKTWDALAQAISSVPSSNTLDNIQAIIISQQDQAIRQLTNNMTTQRNTLQVSGGFDEPTTDALFKGFVFRYKRGGKTIEVDASTGDMFEIKPKG